jgi:alkylated DNA repair dioxygenase AlkB
MHLPAGLEVLYRPGFVADDAGLLSRALEALDWDRRMASRRTASCGIAYNYSGISYPDTPVPDFIALLFRDVSTVVGHPINNCLANHYPDGISSMGFHSDSGERVVPGTTTSLISLGGARRIVFRDKKDRRTSFDLELASGSLLVMGSGVQDCWQHGLPRTEFAEPRVSLTLRHLVP